MAAWPAPFQRDVGGGLRPLLCRRRLARGACRLTTALQAREPGRQFCPAPDRILDFGSIHQRGSGQLVASDPRSDSSSRAGGCDSISAPPPQHDASNWWKRRRQTAPTIRSSPSIWLEHDDDFEECSQRWRRNIRPHMLISQADQSRLHGLGRQLRVERPLPAGRRCLRIEDAPRRVARAARRALQSCRGPGLLGIDVASVRARA